MKKKKRTSSKPYSRSIVGASLDIIQKKRSEKTEVRAAAREAALRCFSGPSVVRLCSWIIVFVAIPKVLPGSDGREIKERIKKTKDEKKAKKVEVVTKTSNKSSGKAAGSRGAATKGPKVGGGGGKR